MTPPHWRREERRLITLKELDQKIKEKLEREEQEQKRIQQKQQERYASGEIANEIETFGYRNIFPPPPSQQHVDAINSKEPVERERAREKEVANFNTLY